MTIEFFLVTVVVMGWFCLNPCSNGMTIEFVAVVIVVIVAIVLILVLME